MKKYEGEIMKHIKKSKNPFEVLSKFYKDSVKKQDKKGTAEKFKLASEIILERSKHWIDNIELTYSDIEYLDGYFVFGHGTNSVVHYHIDQCPGWKFGIWFEDNDNKDTVEYDWFAQYEETIDKFKPTASTIQADGYVDISDKDISTNPTSCFGIYSNIKFIIEHPELAYYRDKHYIDFNTKYVDEITAIKEFKKDRTNRKIKNEIDEEARVFAVDWVTKNILSTHPSSVIIDNGEHCSPRYSVVVKTDSKELLNKGFISWDWEKDQLEFEEVPVNVDPDYSLINEFRKEMKRFSTKLENLTGQGELYTVDFFDYIIEFVNYIIQ